MTDLRYPIGKFKYEGPPTPEQRQVLLREIEQTPANLRAAVKGLSDSNSTRPTGPRAGLCASSHITSRTAISTPTSASSWLSPKTSLPSSRTTKTAGRASLTRRPLPWKSRWPCSIRCMIGGCACCVRCSRKIGSAAFRHPELGLVSLEKNLALYAWHGRHHVAHVTSPAGTERLVETGVSSFQPSVAPCHCTPSEARALRLHYPRRLRRSRSRSEPPSTSQRCERHVLARFVLAMFSTGYRNCETGKLEPALRHSQLPQQIAARLPQHGIGALRNAVRRNPAAGAT